MPPEPIDLHHLRRERIIASYLLDGDDGPALFDCGSATTVGALKAGLADRGLSLTDVRHLLLSHIHLDHAGAAGVLVREHPGLQVHVSPIGAPHLVEPERLEKSARRLYGDTFDSLWGELAPVPADNVHALDGAVLGLESFPAPGHASHHVCYLDPDGTLYAGDAWGVRVVHGRGRAAGRSRRRRGLLRGAGRPRHPAEPRRGPRARARPERRGARTDRGVLPRSRLALRDLAHAGSSARPPPRAGLRP